MRYRFMGHMADAKFRAYGSSLSEAFGNAALAMCSLMYDIGAAGTSDSWTVKVGGRDLHRLLRTFLEEVHFMAETGDFLTAGFEEVEMEESDEGFTLTARLLGSPAPGDFRLGGEVKAVTYSEMMVEDGDSPFVQVVVDV
jgi:SHS2 domain-containing protein